MPYPEISIIVPVYNAAEFLPRCIESILSQKLTDFELILINDGSTDDSGEICDRYASSDNRIKVSHTDNHGVTHARKSGVMQSHGAFICFVDADDYIKPYYLSDLYAETRRIPEADIIYASNSAGIIDSESFINMLLRNTCDWGLPYKLYRRDLFSGSVLDTPRKIHVGEDLISNIKICLNAHSIAFIKCDGYVYYMNPQSVTHSRRFSLTYEETFMDEVEKALGDKTSAFLKNLWVFRLRNWKTLVENGVNVDRNRKWVQWILTNAKQFDDIQTIGDKIILNIPSQRIARLLLKSMSLIRSIRSRSC